MHCLQLAPSCAMSDTFSFAAKGPQKLGEMTSKCVQDRIAQIKEAQASGGEVRRDML